MTIRLLTPDQDLPAVADFLAGAADYWLMAEGSAPGPKAAQEYFTDGPPGHDPARQRHLGLFDAGRLAGLAELSFGFPDPDAAYLGLMIFLPHLRGKGHGRAMLAEVERIARLEAATHLYLAVLEANTRGWAFWTREGFTFTGISRVDNDHGLNHVIRRLVKAL